MNRAARISAAVHAVPDPEIRVVTIADLGIVRQVRTEPDGGTVVTITPTYSGCPAMDAIRAGIRTAALAGGATAVRVDTQWSPPWTTDWITPSARAKLTAAGIAPPPRRPAGPPAPPGARLLPLAPLRPPPAPACPRCGSPDTTLLARFGSTACKALWRCTPCREPFDHFKELA
ncbi:1,2-phenylacetyl-CoA epoxidase subunit PaaD [Streptacidiphilus albus]|uniref:1,2-phenylacetyl-CoA epoxidase subunit PaaD n=1 Tax=Streptacidiphilus albus TaxID=105425 RepID=UPI0009DDF906|nr:1,2-phenylacetyl-CoA epoxidase subunit PaaD [Streptacidiphilus albus]